MKHSLSHKVNPWQVILSSRGPRAVQEFQVKLPLCGDFKLCALKKTLIFEAQYLNKDKK